MHPPKLHPRDISICFELETLCRDQPTEFQIQQLSLAMSLPQKMSVTKKEEELATKQMESDENAVVEVFKNKLKSDQAAFRLYLEDLANTVDAKARQQTHSKLVRRRAGEAAARALADQYINHTVVASKDMVSFMAESSQFIKRVASLSPGGPEVQVIGILDLAVTESSLDDSMTRLASLIRSDPSRSIGLILLPWDAERDIGKQIQHEA